MVKTCKIKRKIWVSKLNPRMTPKQLNEFGYVGRTPSIVLKKVKRHYPKAHLVC